MPTLVELLRPAKVLILDFDGPVCSVFAGYPPARISAAMRDGATDADLVLSSDASEVNDPMDLLVWAAGSGNPRLVRLFEQILDRGELEAVASAAPTDGAVQVIRYAKAAGLTVAIASNNSAECIEAYLSTRGLSALVDCVAGRRRGEPMFMKPHPYVLQQVLGTLQAVPEGAVFLGDSITDVEAARACRVSVIGLVNKPEKAVRLSAARPDALTTTMTEVASALASL